MQPSLLPATRRVASLDGLRGLAALVVLVHHEFLLFPKFARVEFGQRVTLTPFEQAIASTPLHVVWAGDEAVLVFFILSGFVLALPVFRASRFTWRAYYPSRLVRLYLPVIGALACAALLFGFAPWGPGAAGRGVVHPMTAQQVLLDASLSRGSASFADNVLWSLHYELIFSLLLPLYLLVARINTQRWVLLITAVIAVSSVARALDVETVAFLAVFGIGVVLGKHADAVLGLTDRIESLARPALAWWSILVLAVVALMVGWYRLPFSIETVLGWPALLLGATALVVLAATWPGMRRLLETRALRWAGAISFSLYLTHLPIVSAIGHALGPQRAWVSFVVSVPVALLTAWLFLLIVERPSHRLARLVARRVEGSVRRPRRMGHPGSGPASARRSALPSSETVLRPPASLALLSAGLQTPESPATVRQPGRMP